MEMNLLPNYSEIKDFEIINVNGAANFEDFRLERLYNPSDELSERFFRCDLCLVWFFDIVDLFMHVDEQHKQIQIAVELQNTLYNKWEDILNIKKTILSLLSEKHFKGAKRSLKSSLRSFGSITTGIFRPNDNIFEHYLSILRSQMKLLIKENRSIHIGYTETNGSNKLKKRKRKHSSDFSSDDNICLKDRLEGVRNGKKLKIIHDNGSKSTDDESSNLPLENTYYIIPERNDGKALNYSEHNAVCNVLNNFLNEKGTGSTVSMENIILRRFDCEIDEVIPETAITISEWIFPKESYTSWSTMTIHDFLYKKPLNFHNDKESLKNDISHIKNNGMANSESNSVDNSEEMLPLNGHHYKCDTCNKQFVNQLKYINHQFLIHSQTLECELCCEIFHTYLDKDVHFDAHSWVTRWKCGFCNYQYSSLKLLKHHYKLEHFSAKRIQGCFLFKNLKLAHKCKECDAMFSSNESLGLHMTNVHEDSVSDNVKNSEIDDEKGNS